MQPTATGKSPDKGRAEPAPARRQLPEPLLRLGLRAAPAINRALDGAVRRLLSGGRSIVIDGNTLDPAVQLFLAAQRAAGAAGLAVDDDPTATRSRMRASCLALGGPRVRTESSDRTIPGPAGPIPVRHYRPNGTRPAPLLVYYHGGGFLGGDLDSFDAVCRLMCRDSAVHVLSIDYRLAPEHKAPAAVDDAFAAYLWAYEHAGELGALPGRVSVGGDSAGGCLAAEVSRLARDAGAPLPELQLLLYPTTDIDAQTTSRSLFASGFLLTQNDMHWFHSRYLDGSGIRHDDPRVSPLHADDLSALPPALVVTAGFDPLRDEGNAYAEAMRAAGVQVDLREMRSLTHAFINLIGLGGGTSAAINEVTSALRAHLSRS